MELKKVRIENYKCIENSGEFTLEKVTCLVGKNESGKTALLQALNRLKSDIPVEADFNPLIEYPRRRWTEYKRRHGSRPDNVLTAVWDLEENDITNIEGRYGEGIIKGKEVKVTKGYNNKLIWEITIDEKLIVKHFLNNAKLSQEEMGRFKREEKVSGLINKLENLEATSEREQHLLSNLKADFPESEPGITVANLLSEMMPTFLYFGSYYKMAGRVAINNLIKKRDVGELEPKDRIFIALLELVGTTPEGIDEIATSEGLIAELEGIQNQLTDEIFEYWSQNRHLRVNFRFDKGRDEDPPPYNEGWVFNTRIENTRHKSSVNFDERSSGFVWFLSFLVWFSQLKNEFGENLILLIDEPALNLHAKAQDDWLRYINERLAPEFQVIYTTHSPFMVDAKNLMTVRTVEDVFDEEKILGTKVGDKVFSTDADTIFPLQAALGYEITQTLFVGEHTLLVEGPSDLLYLKWFSNELKSAGRPYLDPRWVISPVGGIDKVSTFVTLFGANKLHVAVLTDFHEGQKKKVRDLRESPLLKKGHVFSADMYVSQDEADTEDLLGRPAYIYLVNACYSLEDELALPARKPEGAPLRVAKEVAAHFRTLPPEIPEEFDHFPPASYLLENTPELRESLPHINKALDRFEKLFKDLNGLL